LKSQHELFQILEKMYFFEMDRRDKLESRLSIPLALIAIELGFFSYLIQALPHFALHAIHLVFYTLLILALVLFSICVYYLFRLLLGQKYGYVCGPIDVYEYATSYNDFRKTRNASSKERTLPQELEDMLIEQYRDYGELNLKTNEQEIILSVKTEAISCTIAVGLVCLVCTVSSIIAS
jgi:hypothetical protein